jgi:hypothetical protein
MTHIHNQVVSFSSNKETGVSFHLTGRLFKTLNDIRVNCGLTRSEIIRRSIALYKKAKLNNGNLILRKTDGSLTEIVGF